ncbi:MAG: hypothetical protein KAK01_12410 [Candidatus Marinimicrobia bacterium]|nr:hypothetical protein [Candidatus Neomarinimicrobiota bacterium]
MKSIRWFTLFIVAIPILFMGIRGANPADNNTDSDQACNYLSQSLIHIAREEYNEALTLLELALDLQKTNPELYRLAGQVLEMLDRAEEAITAWQKCYDYATEQALRDEAQLHINNLSP